MGKYYGLINRDAGLYHLLEFERVLNGNNRILRILVPADQHREKEEITLSIDLITLLLQLLFLVILAIGWRK